MVSAERTVVLVVVGIGILYIVNVMVKQNSKIKDWQDISC